MGVLELGNQQSSNCPISKNRTSSMDNCGYQISSSLL